MNWKSEWKPLLWLSVLFVAFYFLPIESDRFSNALVESFHLAQWYAREHILLCLIPAFFIAGAIAVFVSQGSVMKYLGAGANKVVAYAVASVSGSVLAVCSCTVLPLFAGIYRMGAGLGPASAFLYAGPAINVLAVILTARVLGFELGLARAIGAILFSVVIGLGMHFIFRRDEEARIEAQATLPESDDGRPLWQTGLYFGAMVAILVFLNWGKPETAQGIWHTVYSAKWWIASSVAAGLGLMLILWFKLSWVPVVGTAIVTAAAGLVWPEQPLVAFIAAITGLTLILSRRTDEAGDWLVQTYGFARQIMPLLLGGVLVAGLLLGRPGGEGLIPSEWISGSVGGEGLAANFLASLVGAFMYFATLTEIPILQGLIANGMGKGPALALLLAGPALSLPNMLVIRSVMGGRKTTVFVLLVVTMATATGMIYGNLF